MIKLITFLILVTSSIVISQENYLIINLNNDTSNQYEFDEINQVLIIQDIVRIESISITSEVDTLYFGSTFQLEFSILPENASNQNVIWTSSDEDIAMVNDGLVNGIKRGDVIITVESEDGSFKDEIEIYIDYPLSIEDENPITIYPNPVTGKLFISFTEAFPYEVLITDINGNLLFSDYDEQEVNLSNYASGSYFVTFIVNNQYINYQIIKN